MALCPPKQPMSPSDCCATALARRFSPFNAPAPGWCKVKKKKKSETKFPNYPGLPGVDTSTGEVSNRGRHLLVIEYLRERSHRRLSG